MTTVAEAITKHEPAFRKPTATKAARRQREIATGLRAELGGREPTTSELLLIQQVADATVSHESLMAARTRGEPIDEVFAAKQSGLIIRGVQALRSKSGGKARQTAGPSMLDSIIAAKRGAA
jgi:hypothetical protein